ncbi:dephospho-CoA kinase [bacterium]|nr:dephospho-CoA kinase [bacterium]
MADDHDQDRGRTMTMTIAVTGPTGAGKSRLCARLAERGATVVEADRLGHEVLREAAVRAAVVAAFGADILGPDGEIDRGRLGPRVFASPERRRELDRLVHPRLARACTEAVARARGGRSPLVILEAAVYFLLPGPPPVDRTVAVRAPAEVRQARLEATGLPPERAAARVAAQAHLEPTWSRADRIIDNTGDEADLIRVADQLWRELVAPESQGRVDP